MKTTTDVLKVRSMDSGPKYKNLGIDEIVALGGLLTFRNETLEHYTKNEIDKKRIEVIHRESTKRGHASLTTTPQFFFEVEGSRMIDLYGSTFPFGSFIMFSSRRIQVTPDLLIRPKEIKSAQWTSYKPILQIYNKYWDAGEKDKARKILPLGFYSRGFMKFSGEDIIDMIAETESEYMPKELNMMAEKMGDAFKSVAPSLFKASMNREIPLSYPKPGIFHNKNLREITPYVDCEEDALNDLANENKPVSLQDWKNLAFEMQNQIMVKSNLTGSIAVWNEMKRHRTIIQKAESVYKAADRAYDELNSLKRGEKPKRIHIIPGAGAEYLITVAQALQEYQDLKDSIEERDAVYVVPNCVKVDFNVVMNGWHLIDPFGFFGVRECSTADYEIRRIATKLRLDIEKQIPELKGYVGPKCKTGYCPERVPCGVVERYKKT